MDVIVIGAGIVGAACALALSEAGLEVLVIDRSTITSGTTSAGEGNILISDKEPGPELALAQRSRAAWFEISDRLGGGFELEAKGGLVISRNPDGITKLKHFADQQRNCGVDALEVDEQNLRELEPELSRDISFGIHYPEDAQCQPMLAAVQMLREVRRLGGKVREREEVLAIERVGTGLSVRTNQGHYTSPMVVNAAGTWAGEIAKLAGSHLPIAPRRGLILVTAPAPSIVRRKVYDADYVANVASGDADLQSSAVVESTKSGTILIGASRERIGYNSSLDVEILRRLAKQAITLFPKLAKIDLLRAYSGFRPYAPDHLPVIGEDPLVPGLFHAAGHEGAGIGLAPATGELILAAVTRQAPFMDPIPFSPARFASAP
jgi:glycine/D-amino acid oxidase-like deaminating enzyme